MSYDEHLISKAGEPCDTGTPADPCKGCPDCMAIPAPRHCLEKGMWDEQCVLNAEHAGPHK
jgi:hypothetical protein